jgi:L-threonylcarbamoyladenylate synthase
MILDGGATTGGVESTVLSLIHTPPRLLRPGLVLPSQIREVIGEIELDAKFEAQEALLSPGQMLKHYSPHTPLHLVGEEAEAEIRLLLEEGRRVGWLTQSPLLAPHANLIAVSMPTSATEYAARLFDALHHLDALKLDAIFVSIPPTEEAWHAVQDRLKRASSRIS